MSAIATILLALGLMFILVGSLVSIVTAFGNKQHVFGVFSILLTPLCLVYCILNWDKASYPGKMLIGGWALAIAGFFTL